MVLVRRQPHILKSSETRTEPSLSRTPQLRLTAHSGSSPPARTRLFLIRGHMEGAQNHVPMILTPQRQPPRDWIRPHPGTQREALAAGPAGWVLFVGSMCCVPSGFTHLPRDLHPLRTLGRMANGQVWSEQQAEAVHCPSTCLQKTDLAQEH